VKDLGAVGLFADLAQVGADVGALLTDAMAVFALSRLEEDLPAAGAVAGEGEDFGGLDYGAKSSDALLLRQEALEQVANVPLGM
jgi:hypothetical protein